jgi:hypothetical protein
METAMYQTVCRLIVTIVREAIQRLGVSPGLRKRHETSLPQALSDAGGLAFDAFISYSHAADGQLAAALQKGLHRFAKPLFKLHAVRVFRDETTLAMTPKLWPEIEKALRNSRWFILMADPFSAVGMGAEGSGLLAGG